MKKPLVFTFLSALPAWVFGQSSGSFVETYFSEIVLSIALGVALVALLLLVVTLQAVAVFRKTEEGEKEVKETWFSKWWQSINSFKPIEQETVVLTTHEYDGIRELDNNLPPWWKGMFYATIVFGVLYLVNYHIMGSGQLQVEEYETEMAVAAKEVAAYKAAVLAMEGPSEEPVTGPEAIAAGKVVYQKFCSACHGAQGQGGIGPNFVDQYWIHGGSMANIITTIEEGVPTKGMIAWKNQLSGAEIQQVAAFIYDLEGNDPDGQKEPQGELFERVTETEVEGE
ncbi:MAG: cbb3-type cytochrome c oxidase N-terminal domain-containing protein [Cytophagales bacterium]|nr:cbb3-type cytochrome c oxidase N-terminal domain-containing protein [Cytophagales bacterium]